MCGKAYHVVAFMLGYINKSAKLCTRGVWWTCHLFRRAVYHLYLPLAKIRLMTGIYFTQFSNTALFICPDQIENRSFESNCLTCRNGNLALLSVLK